MEKLLLIDGSSLLSTSFFGTLDSRYHRARTPEEKQVFLDKLMRGEDGLPTNGVYGMLKSIEAMLSKHTFSHVVVAWDISRDTFRRDIYPAYKATRNETLPELKSQFRLAQEVLEALGFSQFAYNEFEADDILGTLSKSFKETMPVVIWTKDQDALQLIDDNVNVWLITSKAKDYYAQVHGAGYLENPIASIFPFNQYAFEHIYGIKPLQLIDKKAMEGDTSDNIPGIHGVGEKTSTALINEFGSLEEIYDVLENSTVKELKEMFSELGISSPLKKMMHEITFDDVVDELAQMMHSISDFIYPIDFLGVDLVEYLLSVQDTDKKAFKEILRNVSGYECCKRIVDKIGTFESGKAKEMAFVSKKLATIVRDIPALTLATSDALLFKLSLETKNEVYTKHGFNSLVKPL